MTTDEAILFALRTSKPCGDAKTVDLVWSGEILAGTTKLISWKVPGCKFFVLSEYGYNYIQGSPLVEFTASVNSIPLANAGARIVYPIYALEQTYKLLRKGDMLEMSVKLPAALPIVTKVWARFKGWYYS